MSQSQMDPCAAAALQSRSPKRRAILEAARALFLTHGLSATSVDAIADAAGVSKATIYSHFADKHALFGAIIRARCEEMLCRAYAAPLENLPPKEALTRIAEAFLGMVLHPEVVAMCRVLAAETSRFPELGTVFYQDGPAYTIGHLAAYLDSQQQRGALKFSDSTVAAELFLSMLKNMLHMRLLMGIDAAADPQRVRVVIDESVRVFLRAYEA